jgi:hypothetical protein
LSWERLKKKIHGHVNKVNVGNLADVVRDLLQENIIRGKYEEINNEKGGEFFAFFPEVYWLDR